MSSLEGFNGRALVAAQAKQRAAAAASAVRAELKAEIDELRRLNQEAASDREEARRERAEAAAAMAEIQELRGALLSFAGDSEAPADGDFDLSDYAPAMTAAADLEPINAKIDTLTRRLGEVDTRLDSLDAATRDSDLVAASHRREVGFSRWVDRTEFRDLIVQTLRNNPEILDEFLEGDDDGPDDGGALPKWSA